MKLKLYKNAFVAELKRRIPEHTDAYLNGDFSWTLDPENGLNIREIDAPWFNAEDLQKLNTVFTKDAEVDDPRDALILYSALKDLPPELAKDERIWTTLCHVYCLNYVRARNKRFISVADDLERHKAIQSRFFLVDMNRGAERTNSLSRLWWFGHCTAQVAQQLGIDFEAALEVQLRDTGFRADTIERPEVMASKRIRAAVLNSAFLQSKSEEQFWIAKNRPLYRPVMTRITERATRIFFPSINQSALNKMVDSFVYDQIKSDRVS